MKVYAIGLSHRTAPIAVREKAAFTRAELPHALQSLRDTLDNVVLLSTCNRTEMYTVAPDEDVALQSFMSLMDRKSSWSEGSFQTASLPTSMSAP